MSSDEESNTVGLYAVYLGGEAAPGRFTEDHEVVFVVAPDQKAARTLAKRKWQGQGRGHVDAVRELDVIDGFEVTLSPTEQSEVPNIDTNWSK